MEKEFIPYEQALALRDLGFNELCSHEYNLCDDEIILQYYEDGITNIDLEILTDDINDENMENEDINLINPSFTAPLYQQAFRWFREKHDLQASNIMFSNGKYDTGITRYKGTQNVWGNGPIYDTFEEAELECLKKLIDIQTNER